MKICRTNKAEIIQANFKPEPHTVSLVDDGDWFCVKDGEKIVACLCMKQKNYGIQMDELYTLPEYRGHGVMSKLIEFVCNEVYGGVKIYAHCLASSKNIVERNGFVVKSVVNFKHGTQWRMVRDGGKSGLRM